MLAQRGLRLILDFVPNHVAPDHPWVFEHPEHFVQGTRQDLAQAPETFFEVGATVLAHGRDLYSAPWPDVAQLNAFSPGSRQAAIETVCSIAEQCDGIRCDMAMLLLNDIVERIWGDRVGRRPLEEYWHEVISAVRLQYPNVLFLAETYWDLEWELQQLGFDYCYDKQFYDRLVHGNAESVRLHLTADLDYQDKLVRFVENHDEPRAAATLLPEQERAAAVTMMTLPGAKLLYEGQFEGRRVRPPVFLVRRPVEPIDFGPAGVLPHTAGSGQGIGTARGRMAAVRTRGLARQQQLPEPNHLVLEPRQGTVHGRREPLAGQVASTRASALG